MDFCTTSEAARMLGLSSTAVQTLMDTGALSGWKTRGGHRRIFRDSVHAYQRQNQLDAGPMSAARPPRRIVIVMQDNEEYQRYLQLSPLGSPGSDGVQIHDSLATALVELSRNRPHCLVVELVASSSEQQDTLRALMAINHAMPPVSIYLFTQLSGLQGPSASSPQAPFIHILRRSLTASWLDGFVSGMRA